MERVGIVADDLAATTAFFVDQRKGFAVRCGGESTRVACACGDICRDDDFSTKRGESGRRRR